MPKVVKSKRTLRDGTPKKVKIKDEEGKTVAKAKYSGPLKDIIKGKPSVKASFGKGGKYGK